MSCFSYPWFYTGDVPSWVDWIIDKDEDFTNGIGQKNLLSDLWFLINIISANPGGVNGIDVAIEIPKIRAGDTLKMVSRPIFILYCSFKQIYYLFHLLC